MSYYFSKTLGISFDEALVRVTEELKKEGLGVCLIHRCRKGKLNIASTRTLKD